MELKDQTKIDLLKPIKRGDKEITSLIMRCPTVGDKLASEKYAGESTEQEIVLFGNLCGISPEEIKAMLLSDYLELQRAYDAFLSPQVQNSGAP